MKEFFQDKEALAIEQDLELCFIIQDTIMKVNGLMIIAMEKAFLLRAQEIFIKVNGFMICQKVLDYKSYDAKESYEGNWSNGLKHRKGK